jgi:hypothetical protein
MVQWLLKKINEEKQEVMVKFWKKDTIRIRVMQVEKVYMLHIISITIAS